MLRWADILKATEASPMTARHRRIAAPSPDAMMAELAEMERDGWIAVSVQEVAERIVIDRTGEDTITTKAPASVIAWLRRSPLGQDCAECHCIEPDDDGEVA
jgi:hypothetical protein